MLGVPEGGAGAPLKSRPFASAHPNPMHALLKGFTEFAISCLFSSVVPGVDSAAPALAAIGTPTTPRVAANPDSMSRRLERDGVVPGTSP